MPTQTAHQEWTFEDLYNLLMERIEPELCTYNIGEMDAMYAEEKDKDRTKRYAYYQECLALFWEDLRELVDLTKTELKEFESEFFSRLKEKVSQEEEREVEDISRSIDASS